MKKFYEEYYLMFVKPLFLALNHPSPRGTRQIN